MLDQGLEMCTARPRHHSKLHHCISCTSKATGCYMLYSKIQVLPYKVTSLCFFSCLLSRVLPKLLCHSAGAAEAAAELTPHQRASSDGEGPPPEAASCRDSRQGCQLVSIVATVLWYGHLSIGNQPETAKLIWQKPVNRHQLKTVSSYTPAIWTGLIRAWVRLCKKKAVCHWQWWSTAFGPWKHILPCR